MKIAKMKILLAGVLCCVVASSLTGCGKKWGKGKRGSDGTDNIGGVMGTDIYGEPLSDRPVGGTEVQGDFGVVLFAYDSSQIQPSARPVIEDVAQYLRSNPQVGLIVEGHCDERGSKEYNLALGERRALAVRAYLIGLGIDGSKIQTKSLGEEDPAAFGHDESAWSQNRRAEFLLYY